jgi:hypothetical protein
MLGPPTITTADYSNDDDKVIDITAYFSKRTIETSIGTPLQRGEIFTEDKIIHEEKSKDYHIVMKVHPNEKEISFEFLDLRDGNKEVQKLPLQTFEMMVRTCGAVKFTP